MSPRIEGGFEYTCCECGRHIVRMVGPMPDFPLCAFCLFLPGWFNDPKLRRLLDREVAP